MTESQAPAQKPVLIVGKSILHIEDSEIDHEALTRAFKKIGIQVLITWCKNAEEAHQYLSELEAKDSPLRRPSLILLDLNLPKESGLEFLTKVKAHPTLGVIPVIILSSSSKPSDIQSCYVEGANAYLLKPINSKELETKAENIARFWLKDAVLPQGRLNV